jgi:hypothetical protein
MLSLLVALILFTHGARSTGDYVYWEDKTLVLVFAEYGGWVSIEDSGPFDYDIMWASAIEPSAKRFYTRYHDGLPLVAVDANDRSLFLCIDKNALTVSLQLDPSRRSPVVLTKKGCLVTLPKEDRGFRYCIYPGVPQVAKGGMLSSLSRDKTRPSIYGRATDETAPIFYTAEGRLTELWTGHYLNVSFTEGSVEPTCHWLELSQRKHATQVIPVFSEPGSPPSEILVLRPSGSELLVLDTETHKYLWARTLLRFLLKRDPTREEADSAGWDRSSGPVSAGDGRYIRLDPAAPFTSTTTPELSRATRFTHITDTGQLCYIENEDGQRYLLGQDCNGQWWKISDIASRIAEHPNKST